MAKKTVAIIPARGGSKRIPKKNIKEFFGKPLIAYSIQTALQSSLFDEVIVSTDDEEIAQVARKYGALTPFVRPKELSDDFTGTGAVVAHALGYLQENGYEIDFLCTIYATAPFLEEKYLRLGLEKLKDSSAKYAFSCTSMPFPIQRTFKITQDERCEMFERENFSKRSQDLEPAYQDAGQFYWNNLCVFSDEIMFANASIPIILPRHLVQDIDDEEDWIRAELMYEVLQKL
jgi:pseudaminic acid cytidylyltransferase